MARSLDHGSLKQYAVVKIKLLANLKFETFESVNFDTF